MGWKLPKPEAPAISVGSGLSARPPRDLHWRAAETLLRPMRRHTGVIVFFAQIDTVAADPIANCLERHPGR